MCVVCGRVCHDWGDIKKKEELNKKMNLRLFLPLVVFIALLAIACVIVLRASRLLMRMSPPIDNVDIIPQKPRATLSVLPDPVECLATSPNFSTLRTCDTQADCASCIESPTSCVVVGGADGVDATGKLTYPVSVHVPVSSAVEDCSGHGTRSDQQCVCDGTWNADGSCADVCYTGNNC